MFRNFKLRRFFKYRFLRFMASTRSKSKTMLVPQETLSESQKLAISIVKKLTANPEAEILLLPVGSIDNSTKFCYIDYKELTVKILPSNRVQLINGKYFYEVYLPNANYDEVRLHVYQRMLKKRSLLEKKITQKTERSLKVILQDLENGDI